MCHTESTQMCQSASIVCFKAQVKGRAYLWYSINNIQLSLSNKTCPLNTEANPALRASLLSHDKHIKQARALKVGARCCFGGEWWQVVKRCPAAFPKRLTAAVLNRLHLCAITNIPDDKMCYWCAPEGESRRVSVDILISARAHTVTLTGAS